MRKVCMAVLMVLVLTVTACTPKDVGQPPVQEGQEHTDRQDNGGKDDGRQDDGGQDDGQPDDGGRSNRERAIMADLSLVKPEQVLDNAEVAYSPPGFKAEVPAYTVMGDLSNIKNLDLFEEFDERQRTLLVQNGFFGALTGEEQLFFVYEDNNYKNIPSFITTDSVMHLYHIFYDYTLRKVEREWLFASLEKLTQRMLNESINIHKWVEDARVKEAALKNVAYFTVPAKLLGLELPGDVPEQAVMLAQEELGKIEDHGGRSQSVIFPFLIDYSQFIVRGHYTRSEEFGKFFKAMMWYGQVPFPFEAYMDGAVVRMDEQIIQALIITKIMFSDEEIIDEWDRIYSPTVFYVGSADDVTPGQYLDIVKAVFGDKFDINLFGQEDNLQRVLEESRKLPQPGIKQALEGIPGGRQFRFMGQRYIADSEMLQELTVFDPQLPDNGRPFPRSLDVMSVLGSDRAYDLLINHYREDKKWDKYPEKMVGLKKKFDALPLKTWQSNLYYGWLWSLKALLTEATAGWPSFMQTPAWQDKNLNSASGSWAELRHDTILYGKASGVECGGGEEPPPPKGYVEPNPEYYSRLRWLTEYSQKNLESRGLIDRELVSRFEDFSQILQFLENCSVKELANQTLTDQEYERIKVFGADMEYISASIATDGRVGRWWEITSETDRNMAVVADVHTSLGDTLEAAIGPAAQIFVVVPIEGQLYLTRGAMFSYYEFTHPVSDRLTDEKWQKMLKEGKNPPQPEWTNSFMTEGKDKIHRSVQVYQY